MNSKAGSSYICGFRRAYRRGGSRGATVADCRELKQRTPSRVTEWKFCAYVELDLINLDYHPLCAIKTCGAMIPLGVLLGKRNLISSQRHLN